MASQNIRRTMSYRKPVPKYEPTPPPSPFPVPPRTLPPLQLEATDELLSLPCSWSQSTEQRPDFPEQTVELLVPSMLLHPPDQSTSRTDFLYAPSIRGGTPSANSRTDNNDEPVDRSAERRRRGTHKNFRPPTPPLPAQHKRRRLTAAFPEESAPPVVDNQAPVSQELGTGGTSRTAAAKGPSLRSMPSFVTEKTFVSPHAGDVSNVSAWSGGLTTFVSESDPRLSGYPQPLYLRPAFSEVEFDKSEHQGTSESSGLRNMLGSCGAGVKKFLTNFCC